MSTLMRLVLVVALCLGLVGALLYFGGMGFAILVHECGEVPEMLAQLQEERDRTAELERLEKRLFRRIDGKNQAMAELLGGRLTLVEAAARFRDLEETLGDTPASAWRPQCAATDGERLCREVIHWVYARFRPDAPQLAEELAASLEAELWFCQDRDGTIVLPH